MSLSRSKTLHAPETNKSSKYKSKKKKTTKTRTFNLIKNSKSLTPTYPSIYEPQSPYHQYNPYTQLNTSNMSRTKSEPKSHLKKKKIFRSESLNTETNKLHPLYRKATPLTPTRYSKYQSSNKSHLKEYRSKSDRPTLHYEPKSISFDSYWMDTLDSPNETEFHQKQSLYRNQSERFGTYTNYGFGVGFSYWQKFIDFPFCKAKYENIKEELLYNKIYAISIDEYACISSKCKKIYIIERKYW
eukprot:222861_1